MGQLIKVKCLNCDYSEDFMTGAGFLDDSLRSIAERFKEDVTKHILYISQTFDVDKFEYEKKIAHCNVCQSLQSIPVISIQYNKNSRFNYGFTCEDCGADYTFIFPIHEVCNLNCPKCKTGNLCNVGFGSWD